MIAVCLIKLIPVIDIPSWLFIWIAVIALIRISSLISGFVSAVATFAAIHEGHCIRAGRYDVK